MSFNGCSDLAILWFGCGLITEKMNPHANTQSRIAQTG